MPLGLVDRAATQASGCRLPAGSTIGHSSTRPGACGRALSCIVPTAASSKDRPLKCSGSAKVASTAESTAFAERNDSVRRTSCEAQARRSRSVPSQYRRLVSNSRGAAPWKPKIDCLGSPTAKTVRMRAALARRAGGEILGDVAQDLPLLGVGVLRLVDQHVVDAAVELVQHPGAVAAREQRQRLVDQIVEIERAEPLLVRPRPACTIAAASVNSAFVRSTASAALRLSQNRGEALALVRERVL